MKEMKKKKICIFGLSASYQIDGNEVTNKNNK